MNSSIAMTRFHDILRSPAADGARAVRASRLPDAARVMRRPRALPAFRDANMEEHALMKYAISSLLGPGLVGALLLGSGCMVSPESDTTEEGPGADTGELAGAPRISAKLSYGSTTCLLSADQAEVACDTPVRAEELMQASVDVDWGKLSEGVVVVATTCSGAYVDPVDDGSAHQAAWHAPFLNNMACEVRIDVSSLEGPFATSIMHFSVVDGQPPGEVYGYIYLEHTSAVCRLLIGDFSQDCEPVRPGELTLVYAEVAWGKHAAGSIAVRDTCGGTFWTTDSSDISRDLEWKVPSAPTSCTLELEAITAAGERHVFALNVPVN